MREVPIWFILLLLLQTVYGSSVQAQQRELRIGQGMEEVLVVLGGAVTAIDTVQNPGSTIVHTRSGQFLGKNLSYATLWFHQGELYAVLLGCEGRLLLGDDHTWENRLRGYAGLLKKQYGEPLEMMEEFAVLDSLGRINGAPQDIYIPGRGVNSGYMWRTSSQGEDAIVTLGAGAFEEVQIELFSMRRFIERYGLYQDPRCNLPIVQRFFGPDPGWTHNEIVSFMKEAGYPDPIPDTLRGVLRYGIDPSWWGRHGEVLTYLLPRYYRFWLDDDGELAATASSIYRWDVHSAQSLLPLFDTLFVSMLGPWQLLSHARKSIHGEAYEVLEEIARIAPELHPHARLPRESRYMGLWRVPSTEGEYVALYEEKQHDVTLWRFSIDRLRNMARDPRYDEPFLSRLFGPAEGARRDDVIEAMERFGFPNYFSDTIRNVLAFSMEPRAQDDRLAQELLPHAYRFWFDTSGNLAITESGIQNGFEQTGWLMEQFDKLFGKPVEPYTIKRQGEIRTMMEEIGAIIPQLHPGTTHPRYYTPSGLWQVTPDGDEYIALYHDRGFTTLWRFSMNHVHCIKPE